MSSAREIERIRKAYEGYRTGTRQGHWSWNNRGNQAIRSERRRVIRDLLIKSDLPQLDAQCILEIGCGNGNALDEFAVLGAGPGNLHGVDLIADRIATAKAQYPGFDFHCANAEALGFPDSTFDLVLLFTVFSSIADLAMQENVSREASRVLKKMGAVMWYDLRYNNPGNPNVRGITKRDIQRLFPDFMISLRTLTLLPPLARRLGPGTAVLYPLLSRIPFLRTHYIGLLSRA